MTPDTVVCVGDSPLGRGSNHFDKRNKHDSIGLGAETVSLTDPSNDTRNPPRYVPVRYSRTPRLMKAAIEDRRDRIVIRVINASVAVTLADLLNREDRHEPLPEAYASAKPVGRLLAAQAHPCAGS